MLYELAVDTRVLTTLRDGVLRPRERLAAPPLERRHTSSLDEAEKILRDQLVEHGLGLVRFEQEVVGARFIDLGSRFGELMVENAPDVQPFAKDGVILHLRQETLSGRVEDAPFEPRELLLHTEGSRRPVEQQPRFIMLYCVSAGTDAGAQTVLVPFSGVLGRIEEETREVLRETKEARVAGTPTILVPGESNERFSFRDLGEETYLWESPHPRNRVENALVDLLTTCYTTGPAYGSHWSERDVLVIDNQRWFHGRTWSRPSAEVRTPRHLTRLRIREPRP